MLQADAKAALSAVVLDLGRRTFLPAEFSVCGESDSLVLDYGLLAAVVAALAAHSVVDVPCAAVRADSDSGSHSLVVGATLGRAGLGLFSFRMCHCSIMSFCLLYSGRAGMGDGEFAVVSGPMLRFLFTFQLTPGRRGCPYRAERPSAGRNHESRSLPPPRASLRRLRRQHPSPRDACAV